MSDTSSSPEDVKASRVLTFGCRLNTSESAVMQAHAEKMGLSQAIIINTCAVTAEAQRQAKQAIRRARRENPEAFIIVTGCAVQVDPSSFSAMPEVDRLLGNHEKMKEESFAPHLPERIVLTDIQEIEETASHLSTGLEGNVRAFLQIQNGCDHRCTYCIIPYGRGKSRSVPQEILIPHIEGLLASGVQEIVLTGVDLTAYGEDLPSKPTLSELTRDLLKALPHLPRLRISSLDPAELDDLFFQLVAEESRLMPHFHLSLQAGDDIILKRMKRRHLRHHIVSFCERIRQLRPDVLLGADVIAGFPTETEEQFQNTYTLLEACNIPLLHVFPYSSRPGTPAARMPQLPRTIIKERAFLLRQLGERLRESVFQKVIGETLQVLLEKPLFGHSDHFLPIQLTQPSIMGKIVPVTITHRAEGKLWGQVNE
jgi:threonylcarbamoyladenosine tRNA methylthiotransferase MtaB